MALYTGTTGTDWLVGSNAADQIDGLAGDDTLVGRRGDDTMNGGEDQDTYVIYPGDGYDRLSLRSGDTILFSGFPTLDSFDDLQGHITVDRKASFIDVAGAAGEVKGDQLIRASGNPLTPDNVAFFTITPLGQEGQKTFRPQEENGEVEDRRDPEIPTLEEELGDIKPPEPDPGWLAVLG